MSTRILRPGLCPQSQPGAPARVGLRGTRMLPLGSPAVFPVACYRRDCCSYCYCYVLKGHPELGAQRARRDSLGPPCSAVAKPGVWTATAVGLCKTPNPDPAQPRDARLCVPSSKAARGHPAPQEGLETAPGRWNMTWAAGKTSRGFRSTPGGAEVRGLPGRRGPRSRMTRAHTPGPGVQGHPAATAA